VVGEVVKATRMSRRKGRRGGKREEKNGRGKRVRKKMMTTKTRRGLMLRVMGRGRGGG